MPTVGEIQSDYKLALDVLHAMARRDILAAWKGVAGEAWLDSKVKLEDDFATIVEAYGVQAAATAADYVFLQRSLDDDLSNMAYPELTEPVDRKRAKASARWALRKVTEEQREEDMAAAQTKLINISKRLTLEPARQLVLTEAEKQAEREWYKLQLTLPPELRDEVLYSEKEQQRYRDTHSPAQIRRAEQRGLIKPQRYFSLPSPGSCAWCLLIASKGDEFHKSGVGGYHDGCRCVPMLATPGAPEPKIIGEIQSLRIAAQDYPGYGEHMAKFDKANPKASDWRRMAEQLNFAMQSDSRYLKEFQKFPPVPGVKIPRIKFDKVKYRDEHGELHTVDAPMTHQLAGHVLYGWRADQTELHYRMLKRKGHVRNSSRKKTQFSPVWDDQKVIDVVAAALEDDGEWMVEPILEKKFKVQKFFYIDAPELLKDPRKSQQRDHEVVKLQFYLDGQSRPYGLTAFPAKKTVRETIVAQRMRKELR